MFDLKITIPNPTLEKINRLEAITIGLEPVPMTRWDGVAFGVYWFHVGTFGVARSIRSQLAEIEPEWSVQMREHTSVPGQ